jgi:predicted nucleic-acid-binding Zn-ribbon protein
MNWQQKCPKCRRHRHEWAEPHHTDESHTGKTVLQSCPKCGAVRRSFVSKHKHLGSFVSYRPGSLEASHVAAD